MVIVGMGRVGGVCESVCVCVCVGLLLHLLSYCPPAAINISTEKRKKGGRVSEALGAGLLQSPQAARPPLRVLGCLLLALLPCLCFCMFVFVFAFVFAFVCVCLCACASALPVLLHAASSS